MSERRDVRLFLEDIMDSILAIMSLAVNLLKRGNDTLSRPNMPVTTALVSF